MACSSTTVSAAPTWSASFVTSAESSVSPTTRRVQRIISAAKSKGWPSSQRSTISRAARVITAPKADHALAVEGRLRDAALALPEITLAGDQAVAQDHPQHLVAARLLDVVLHVGDQHVLHQAGVPQHVAVQHRQGDAGERAVLQGGALHHLQRVGLQLGQHPEEGPGAGQRGRGEQRHGGGGVHDVMM